jgi:hypothetical protein
VVTSTVGANWSSTAYSKKLWWWYLVDSEELSWWYCVRCTREGLPLNRQFFFSIFNYNCFLKKWSADPAPTPETASQTWFSRDAIYPRRFFRYTDIQKELFFINVFKGCQRVENQSKKQYMLTIATVFLNSPDSPLVYRRELYLAISSSPVTKTMYICLVRCTAICVGKENF